MSERYTKLFSLPVNLYSEGAPVVIAAGALHKDNQTGKVFIQLKFRNIQDKPIKAASVKIAPFDTIGNTLGEPFDYQYLDLAADRDVFFGQKTPIMPQDASTRSFAVFVEEIIFSDNSIWTATDKLWGPLSSPVELKTALQDDELVKQYRIEYGANCNYIYRTEKDLWQCPCGAINHNSEPNCHSCHKEAAVLAAMNMDKLKTDCDQRLAEEQKKAIEEKAATEEKKRKTKKVAIIATPILIILVIAVVLISNAVKKADAYNVAIALAESEKYDEAYTAFTELGDYKDSAERATALYAKAYPIRLITSKIASEGTPVDNFRIEYIKRKPFVKIKKGSVFRSDTQTTILENTKGNCCKLYTDNADPDCLILHLYSILLDKEDNEAISNIDVGLKFEETRTRYIFKLDYPDSSYVCGVGSIDNASYKSLDPISIDELYINGEEISEYDENIKDYEKIISQCNLFGSINCMDYILSDELGLDITLRDLGFENFEE